MSVPEGDLAGSLPLSHQNETVNPAAKERSTITKNLVTTTNIHHAPSPPASSEMSFQSDASMEQPTDTGESTQSTSPHPRPPSPVPSVMSMRSMDLPPTFTRVLTQTTAIHHARPPSSVSSIMSFQSNSSMNQPPKYTEEFTQGDCTDSVICAVCPKRAFKSCLTCMDSFCETHVSDHYTAPALQRHKLVDATGDLQQRLCQQHHRELEFYCRTDQTPVCALCAVKHHSGHDVELVENNEQSLQMKECELTAQKNLLDPKPIQLISVNTDSVCLTWGAPDGLTEPHSFRVTWRSETDHGTLTVPGQQVDIQNLTPGEKYTFTVAIIYGDGSQSTCVSTTVRTDTPAPENVSLEVDPTLVSVSWSKPRGVDEVSYLLTLSSDGECLKTVCTKSLQCSFSGLDKEREYSISAITVQTKGGQSKPICKIITIGREQLASTRNYLTQLIVQCSVIKSGSPACYLLPTEKSEISGSEAVRRWTFGKRDETKPTKTILIVGETGTGKTTLINTMVNYMLGVKWEDRVWFKISEKDKNKSQTESQTTVITVYELFLETCPSCLRIIDTPGYGATDGFEFDQQIPKDLQVLFRSEDGIHEVEAVGLVVKASQNRLTFFQRYIFDAILSLFGKDIEKNIVILSTHSDSVPTANIINALKEAGVPFAIDGEPLIFTFNNRQSETYKEDQEDFFKSCWNLGYKSMKTFFKVLEDFETTELKMTEGVLRERKRLEAIVYNLQDAIKMEELKQNMLKQTQRALKKNKNKIGNNENFTYEVDEPYKDVVPIKSSWWHLTKSAMCCTVCEENCHYPGCWWVKDLSWCSVMKDGHCTVCTNKCPVSAHVKQRKIYVPKTRKAIKVAHDLMQQYEQHVDAKKALEKELKDTKDKKLKLLEDAYQCIMELEKIALKLDSFSTIDQLDFLIEKMRETGDAEKVKTLEKLSKQYEDSYKKRRGYLKTGLDKISECYSASRSHVSGKPTPEESPPFPHMDSSANARIQKGKKHRKRKKKRS
ncbi:uncharacterized protein LOC121709316 isoform X2 [Alosa sapidissima]|uniref:uncharacterized protein LOC121709316 isoform X2 n=1 Tax=Alosa sapidissima TaxID=34773 RepID=UPI001C0A0C94|nr:uncharacterized protein LOC121709316 isoform X2 [Alosa sapidissima]